MMKGRDPLNHWDFLRSNGSRQSPTMIPIRTTFHHSNPITGEVALDYFACSSGSSKPQQVLVFILGMSSPGHSEVMVVSRAPSQVTRRDS